MSRGRACAAGLCSMVRGRCRAALVVVRRCSWPRRQALRSRRRRRPERSKASSRTGRARRCPASRSWSRTSNRVRRASWSPTTSRPLPCDRAAARRLPGDRDAQRFSDRPRSARSRSSSAGPSRSIVTLRPAGVAETITVSRRVADRRHGAHRRQQRRRRDGDREPADQRPPLGELRAARPGRHQRRQLRPRELPRHLGPLQQQHGRRRRQQPGVLLRSARPHAHVVLDQPGGDQGVPGRHQQLLGRVRPRRRRHGQRGHQVGHQRVARRGASTSCATTRSRRRSRSSRPASKPDERRQQFGVARRRPDQRRTSVFFFVNYDQQLRDFPVLRASERQRDVLHRRLHGRRAAPRRSRSSSR